MRDLSNKSNLHYPKGRNGRLGWRKENPKKTLTIRITQEAHTNYFEINKVNGKGSAIKIIESALSCGFKK